MKRLLSSSGEALLGLVPAFVALQLSWNATHQIKSNKKTGVIGLPADDFTGLAWLGLVLLLAAVLLGVWKRRELLLGSVALSGQALFIAGVATLSMAWAGGRQNYWDAYHFAAIAWVAELSALTALGASWFSSRRLESASGRVLLGPSAVCLLLGLTFWLWTWNPWLQDLVAWIGRTLFLATHG